MGAKVQSSFNRSFDKATKSVNNLTNTVKGAAAAYVSLSGASKLFNDMTESASGLEAYRGTLNVVMKDYKKAAETMTWASQFANKTPFETESVVEATVKLESYHLKAQQVLPKVGDMAAVMNKDIIQAVEAVADAQNGELERLKEFGITKQQIIEHGQKKLKLMDIVNKKGQITNQESLNKALFSLMEERFSGGMAQQADMYKGVMSTITGVWKNGLAAMAGVKMSGEVADGSLFDMLKVNAKSVAKMLTQFVEDGTFERAGQKIAAFFKFIGRGVDLAKVGMKKAWPYIKKTGKIMESLLHTTLGKVQALQPVFDKLGKQVDWFKKIFLDGFNKAKIIVGKNVPQLNKLGKSISTLVKNVKGNLSGAFKIAEIPIKWIFQNGLPLVVEGIFGVINIATDLFNYFNSKWPQISTILEGIGNVIKNVLVEGFKMLTPIIRWIINDGLPGMMHILKGITSAAIGVANFIVKNWSWIEPIVVGITTALVLYKTTMIASEIATKAFGKAAKIAATGIKFMGTAFKFLTSSAGIVTIAIAAIVAIGWVLYKNWDKVCAFMKKAMSAVGKFFKGVGNGMVKFFKAAGRAIGKAMKATVLFFLRPYIMAFKVIKKGIQVLWAIFKWLGNGISNAFITTYNLVTGTWDAVGTWFASKFDVIGNFATGIGEKIGDAFSYAWDWVKNTWSGLGNWFGGLLDGVGDNFKGTINFFSKGLNWLIDGLNKISIDVPDWVPKIGGKSFGVSIPKIPMLATGGVTTGPTLAMIGEGREQEAVLPLSVLERLLKLGQLRKKKMEDKRPKGRSLKERLSKFTSITNNNQKIEMHFEYKPEMNFYGDVNKEDVKKVNEEGFKHFQKSTRKTFDRDKRLKLRTT